MSNSDWWTTKRKRDVARRMIESGHKNNEIKEYLTKKAGSGISSENLAQIRADSGKSGPNRKKKTNGKIQKNGKITKEDVMVLQGQDLDPHFKKLLLQVKEAMIAHDIQVLELDRHGRVKASQLQDIHVSV